MAGFTSVNEYGWFSTSGRKSENVQLKNQNVNNKAACITQNLLKVWILSILEEFVSCENVTGGNGHVCHIEIPHVL